MDGIWESLFHFFTEDDNGDNITDHINLKDMTTHFLQFYYNPWVSFPKLSISKQKYKY